MDHITVTYGAQGTATPYLSGYGNNVSPMR